MKGGAIGSLLVILGITFLIMGGLHISGVSSLSVAPLGFDTDTKPFNPQQFAFRGHWAMNTELLDGHQYITGPRPEIVVAEAEAIKTVLNARCIRDSQYRVFFSSGGTWTLQQVLPGGFVATSTFGWTNSGAQIFSKMPAVSGFLKVEFWIHSNDFCGLTNVDEGWHLALRDHAYVQFGGGSVAFDRGRYQVGDTAIIHLELGFAESAKEQGPEAGNWVFQLFSNAQNRIVVSKTYTGPDPFAAPDGIFQTNIEYVVTDADFRLTTQCSIAGALNSLDATIFNSLVNTDSDHAATIDLVELGPPTPSLNVDKASYIIGDLMSIVITTSENSGTAAKICGVQLVVSYINPTLKLVDLTIDIDSAGKAYYTVQGLPSRGVVSVRAHSWDEAGRPSDRAELFVDVLDPSVAIDQIPVHVYIILAITGMLAFMIHFIQRIPPSIRIVISGIAGGVFVWIVFIWFAWPLMMDWWISVRPWWWPFF